MRPLSSFARRWRIAGARLARAAMVLALLAPAPSARAQERVLVFAAASLRTALEEVVADWSARTGLRAVVSPAASSALARQIAAGAPADLFISANRDWMDWLEAQDLLQPGSRLDLLENTLVLIAAPDPDRPDPNLSDPELSDTGLSDPDLPGQSDPGHTAQGAAADLPQVAASDLPAPGARRGVLAMALVDAVPAGIYGKAALETLGVWERMAPGVAQTDNVRAALALVASGAAPLGIVYLTDALAEPRVRILGRFSPGGHPRIVYPAALTRDAGPAAAALLDHLAGPEAAAVFAAHGFAVAGD